MINEKVSVQTFLIRYFSEFLCLQTVFDGFEYKI